MVEKIKVLCSIGLSQGTIGKGIGVDGSTVGKWISGQRNISEANEKRAQAYINSLIETLEKLR